MFGFSQKDKEEKQKLEAIVAGLDLILRQFNQALRETANVFNLQHKLKDDPFKDERYLAFIYAVALSAGAHMDARESTITNALKDYFYAFKDGQSLYQSTVNGNLYSRHKNLMTYVANYYDLVITGRGKNEELLMSLAQVYLES